MALVRPSVIQNGFREWEECDPWGALQLFPSHFWTRRSRTQIWCTACACNCGYASLCMYLWESTRSLSFGKDFMPCFPVFCCHCTYSYCQIELNKFLFDVQWYLDNKFIHFNSLFLVVTITPENEGTWALVVITQWILIWGDIVRYESMALLNWKKSINKTSSTLSTSDNGHIPGFSTISCIPLKNSILSL